MGRHTKTLKKNLKWLTRLLDPTAVRKLTAKRQYADENSIRVDWNPPISTGSHNFVYLLRYDGKNETMTNTEFSFKLERTDRKSLEIEVASISGCENKISYHMLLVTV